MLLERGLRKFPQRSRVSEKNGTFYIFTIAEGIESKIDNLSGVSIAPGPPPALFVTKRKPRSFLGK